MLTLQQMKKITNEDFEAVRPSEGDAAAIEGRHLPKQSRSDFPPWFQAMVTVNVEAVVTADCIRCLIAACESVTFSSLVMGWNLCEQYYKVAEQALGETEGSEGGA